MQWTDIKIICDKKFEDVFDYVSAEVCPMGVQIEDYSNLEQDEFYGERCDNVPLASCQAIAVCTTMAGVELVVPSALP